MRKQHFLFAPLVLSLLASGSPALGDPLLPEVAHVAWQYSYSPGTMYNQAELWDLGFYPDGTLLVVGQRSEPDSISAVGIRLNPDTGRVLDTPPEWFLFENTWGDYAWDLFRAVVIDDRGNVFLAGSSYAERFNTWSVRYNVPNVWAYPWDYENDGTPDRPTWRSYYKNPEARYSDYTRGEYLDLARADDGSLFAVGWVTSPTNLADRNWIIDKFDADGQRMEGFPLFYDARGLYDYAHRVALDSQGNLVVIGQVQRLTVDTLVRKYQPDGTLLWEMEIDSGGDDAPWGLAIDSNDDILVVGQGKAAPDRSDIDWHLFKLAAEGDGQGGGQMIWEQFWDDGNLKDGLAQGIALDRHDNLYVVGRQMRDSDDPAYTNRYRPVVQYRDGRTGQLLNDQSIILSPTPNDQPAEEHDVLHTLALRDRHLAIVGYTIQDGPSLLVGKSTGRVVMLDLNELSVDIRGGGGLSSDPAGIERGCDNPCKDYLPTGFEITLQPVLGEYWTEGSWTWGGACSGSDVPCTLIMNGDWQATLDFQCRKLTLPDTLGQVRGEQTWRCAEVAVPGALVIAETAKVRLEAENGVTLGPGFRVERGAELAVGLFGT